MREVKSLTYYFSVPKGGDTHIVYNGTSSDLSAALWDPHFFLPTIKSTLRAADRGAYIADLYFG